VRSLGARRLLGVLLAVMAALIAADVGGLVALDDPEGAAKWIALFEVLFLVVLVPPLSVIRRSWRREELNQTETFVVIVGWAGLLGALVWAWLWFAPRLGG
jgi:hypothetical protein